VITQKQDTLAAVNQLFLRAKQNSKVDIWRLSVSGNL